MIWGKNEMIVRVYILPADNYYFSVKNIIVPEACNKLKQGISRGILFNILNAGARFFSFGSVVMGIHLRSIPML